MPRKPNEIKSAKIPITVSKETEDFLLALARNGGYFGNSAPEIAAAMVEDRVVELVKEGFLEKGQASRNLVKAILQDE